MSPPLSFKQSLRVYLEEMRDRRGSGAATDETTYYSPLEKLINAVGDPAKCAFAIRAR